MPTIPVLLVTGSALKRQRDYNLQVKYVDPKEGLLG